MGTSLETNAQSARSRGLGELCFATFVFGGHARYVPYYVYSALTAYPEAWVKVFHEAPLPENVKLSLGAIRSELSDRFDVSPYSPKTPTRESTSLRVDPRTFVRFILPPHELEPFSVAYVGDVDMFYLRESPTLLEFHRAHMAAAGIPISNCVRRSEDGTPTRRLTGLHCFETAPYLAALRPVIDDLRSNTAKLAEFLTDLSWDEEALFKLVASAYDLTPLTLPTCVRPWHGMHLGAARKHRPTSLTEERFLANSSLSREACAEQVARLLGDPLLESIIRRCPETSVLNYLMFLGLRPKSVSVRAIALRHAVVGRLKEVKRRLEARLDV